MRERGGWLRSREALTFLGLKKRGLRRSAAAGLEGVWMNRRSKTRFCVTAIWCAVLLVPSGGWSIAANEAQAQQSSGTPAGTAEEATAGIPPEQLDALVAPIALYPDPLLAQVLVASTYPLEIIQLQQWLAKNPGIEGDALVDAVAKIHRGFGLALELLGQEV